jgi:serine/threonine-protein kinase
MAYVPGVNSQVANRILAFVDRSGARKPIPVPLAPYIHPRISPNGKQLAVGSDDGKEAAIWVYDLGGTTSMRKLTFGGANRFPLWTRDGQRVVFQSDRDGDASLFWQRADGSGSAERLAKLEQKQASLYSPDFWSLDGKTVILSSSFGVNGASISSVSIERDAKPKVLIDAPSKRDDSSSVSPDGRWIAYESNDGGQMDIYVQAFPPTGPKYQLTTAASFFPVWSPDGKQIFFLQGQGGIGRIHSIDVQTQPSFAFGKPTPLPIDGILTNGGAGMPRGYDITPDGKQFLVMLPAFEADSNTRQLQQIYVTLNWLEELKKRVASK